MRFAHVLQHLHAMVCSESATFGRVNNLYCVIASVLPGKITHQNNACLVCSGVGGVSGLIQSALLYLTSTFVWQPPLVNTHPVCTCV